MVSLDKRYKTNNIRRERVFSFSISVILLSLISSLGIFLCEKFNVSSNTFLAIFDTSVIVLFFLTLFLSMIDTDNQNPKLFIYKK